eukprot:COSAG03_NODE_1438_length_4080_cov_1.729465_2_plen_167_part_00
MWYESGDREHTDACGGGSAVLCLCHSVSYAQLSRRCYASAHRYHHCRRGQPAQLRRSATHTRWPRATPSACARPRGLHNAAERRPPGTGDLTTPREVVAPTPASIPRGRQNRPCRRNPPRLQYASLLYDCPSEHQCRPRGVTRPTGRRRPARVASSTIAWAICNAA